MVLYLWFFSSQVSLYVLNPTRNHTKLVSGTAGTDVKDVLKMVAFSFGIDAKDTDRYELVARSPSGSLTEMKKYSTIKKIQTFLDSHSGSMLHLRRKSSGGSMDRKTGQHVAEQLKKEDSSNDFRKITHRKRSNSFS